MNNIIKIIYFIYRNIPVHKKIKSINNNKIKTKNILMKTMILSSLAVLIIKSS